SFLKFSTVFGAASDQNSMTISPSLVLITATSLDGFIGEVSLFSSATAAATSAVSNPAKIDNFILTSDTNTVRCHGRTVEAGVSPAGINDAADTPKAFGATASRRDIPANCERARSGDNTEPQLHKFSHNRHNGLFVAVFHADENVSASRQRRRRGHLRFCIGETKIDIHSHDFASRFHFRTKRNIHSLVAQEWKNG